VCPFVFQPSFKRGNSLTHTLAAPVVCEFTVRFASISTARLQEVFSRPIGPAPATFLATHSLAGATGLSDPSPVSANTCACPNASGERVLVTSRVKLQPNPRDLRVLFVHWTRRSHSHLAIVRLLWRALFVRWSCRRSDFPRAANSGRGAGAGAVAHLDGDAVSDFVFANLNRDDPSLLLGNGDETFQVAIPFAVGDQPGSLAQRRRGSVALDLAATIQERVWSSPIQDHPAGAPPRAPPVPSRACIPKTPMPRVFACREAVLRAVGVEGATHRKCVR
jgi:hypothetical protein